MIGNKTGFTIGAVAKIYDIHPQTLRVYERKGLLDPARTRGNTRNYREKDLWQLELILSLTRDLGVNLAGVEVVQSRRNEIPVPVSRSNLMVVKDRKTDAI